MADPILHGRVTDTHLELCDGRRTRNIALYPRTELVASSAPSHQPGSEITALLVLDEAGDRRRAGLMGP